MNQDSFNICSKCGQSMIWTKEKITGLPQIVDGVEINPGEYYLHINCVNKNCTRSGTNIVQINDTISHNTQVPDQEQLTTAITTRPDDEYKECTINFGPVSGTRFIEYSAYEQKESLLRLANALIEDLTRDRDFLKAKCDDLEAKRARYKELAEKYLKNFKE